MQKAPVYIVSDAHLGAASPETERAFLSWLDHCGQNASQVVINGDLFDFWFEYGSVIPRGYTRVLGALSSLVDSGIPVVLMGGNHDWWGGSFLREEIGLDFYQEPVVLDLHDRKTLLAHGDGLAPGEISYRLLRFVFRARPVRLAFKWLHPDLGAWVAGKVSKTETRVSGPSQKQEELSELLEVWARTQLRDSPELDLVVLGHTHIPALLEVGEGRHYLNSGDWFSGRNYAVLAPGEAPELRTWEGPGSVRT